MGTSSKKLDRIETNSLTVA